MYKAVTDLCGHLVQFTPAQRVQEVALQDDALALSPGQTLLDQMLGTGFHGVADLATESAHSERHGVAFDQPVVEPGRALRGELLGKIEIGADRQHHSRPWIAGLTEASDFDDSANGRGMFEGLDTKRTW
jgi:hypothetical protein